MNALTQNIALAGIPASRTKAIATPRKQDIAARRIARAALFQDSLETALTGLVFLGCLLFAAAALRLAIAPCALRHWGVLGLYGVAAALSAFTVFAIAKDMLQFKKTFS